MTPQDELASQPLTGDSSAEVGQVPALSPLPPESSLLKQILFGPNGLRVGWSVVLFFVLVGLFAFLFGGIARLVLHDLLHIKLGEFNAYSAVFNELVQFLALLAAAEVSARIENREVLDYNLNGPSRLRHFSTGLLGGFVALSALVFALFAGGWLHFGPIALTGAAIAGFGLLWGIAFLFTGLSEEGMVRCYLQYTLTRGIHYWWALGLVAAMCGSCALFVHNQARGACMR